MTKSPWVPTGVRRSAASFPIPLNRQERKKLKRGGGEDSAAAAGGGAGGEGGNGAGGNGAGWSSDFRVAGGVEANLTLGTVVVNKDDQLVSHR